MSHSYGLVSRFQSKPETAYWQAVKMRNQFEFYSQRLSLLVLGYNFFVTVVAEPMRVLRISGLQIAGDAFPGQEIQACGFSINVTTVCIFQWVRHFQDGTMEYITDQPIYLVTADDVDAHLAIQCAPMDDKKRKMVKKLQKEGSLKLATLLDCYLERLIGILNHEKKWVEECTSHVFSLKVPHS
ncbi:uncharacterized protein LOC110008143 [Amborella trichopoda]|uniref:uncharacterized protein LOC110008143 n=1 Tax=Amborella trichopoda TaxID=13333 RepID=UPI0009BF4B9F|nr:uncharacterized protein LOC110008143 [Amborella trichopoda]|eukprot:XP_020529453.1 uncharacterized protein LOC110008143 [Amborella trichopoda]